jgi:hypothetical protein
MTLETIGELDELTRQILLLADAEVVRHDKGPEHEPSQELLRALAYTGACRRMLAILHRERLARSGEVAWLDWPGLSSASSTAP